MNLIIATVICGSLSFEVIEPGYLSDKETDELPDTCYVRYEHVQVVPSVLKPQGDE